VREELENGIYGMVVSLCQEISRAENKPIPVAQEEVALWLIQVAASLKDLNKEKPSNGS
jgi:hypothetical protein